jgi:hypothetical protein
MAEPNLTEVVATTLRNRSLDFADNVSKGNALLTKISSSGNVNSAGGGRTIVQELEYAENATFKYYSGYETLDIAPTDVFDAAEYNWKQAAVVVSASGLEVNVMTTGKEATLKLLEKRISNAMKTMRNNISIGIYSDGTGSSAKQITGLQAQIADVPSSGVVGGIDRSNWSFWRNQIGSAANIDKTTIQGLMKAMWLATQRGPDTTKLIVADSIRYTDYWDSLTTIQRITREDKGMLGWETLAFLSAEVVYDGDSGLPAEHMYYLNTDYLFWRPHTIINMVPLDRRNSLNQDAFVVPVVFAGNLTMSNAARQGVIFDSV